MWLRNNLANLLTLGNLLCGVIAVLYGLLWVQTESVWYLWYGCAAVLGGALLDALDGAVARALRADSALGLQLDSLADVVTFGVAPSLLLYHLLQHEALSWVAFVALGLPLLSAWRLARFNSSPVGHGSTFQGLPTPANGLYICALTLALYTELYVLLFRPAVIAGLILLQCWLLVSHVPFFSLKGGIRRPHLLLLGVTGLATWWLGWGAAPVAMLAYLLLSWLAAKGWLGSRANVQ